VNILLSLDGVLSSEHYEANRIGAQIYYALKSAHRVTLYTSWSAEKADNWLAVNGIIEYDDLLTDEYDLVGEDLKKRQLTISRSRQAVELVVDADPSFCAWAFEQGVPALLFANTELMSVPNRPDAPKGMRRWDEIEAAIIKKNLAKTEQVTRMRAATNSIFEDDSK
jgi:hypothetical protein